MKNKLLSILLHPLFIALAISLVIIYFLPDYFTKYKVELVEHDRVGKTQKVYFEDLNGNNKSEKIVTQDNRLNNASFIIYNEKGGIIDQWNFEKKYALKNKTIQFFDLDKNGYSEVYFVTQKKDSAFLNSIEPLNKQNNNIIEIFIDTIGKYNNKYKISSASLMFDKSSSADKNILYLSINCGFSGYPRNIYKINIKKKSVDRSPHLTNHSRISHLVDLNNDGSNEIIIRNGSSSNTISPAITTRSDHSSWLMVLDNDLNFLFEPIEFKIPYSGIKAFPIKKKKEILAFVKSKQGSGFSDKLYIFSKSGKVIQEKTLPPGTYHIFSESDKNNFFLLNKNNGFIQNYNFDFEELNSFFIESKSMIYPLDIDEDNKTEWLVISLNSSEVIIYRTNFKDPANFQISNDSSTYLDYDLKKVGEKENEIFFRKGMDYYIFKYGENPLYIFKYLIYFGIFLVVLVMVWLARKGQKIKMEKQRAIEDQISELQIKTIKNQVDPHFVFNAVNTISEMMLTDDKLEADRFISKFSKLMRETLQKSDKISTTLQEEIDYIENYIQLQQIRFSNSFEYKIKKDINIDYQTLVPKHVLYSYVENAIKHGLSDISKNGLLTISAKLKNKDILLSIEDNGGGIDKSRNNQKNSTGSGVRIMEEMFTLYEKLFKKKVTHKIIELFDKDGKKVGIRVEVIISK